MNPLHIDFSRRDGEPCWALRGEMDIANYEDLRPEAILAEAGASPRIHLDLTPLAYMDSSALRQLITVSRMAAANGIQLLVHVRAGSLVHRVIRSVGASDVIYVICDASVDDEEDTVDASH